MDQRLTRDVDRLCTDLAELIPTMVCALKMHKVVAVDLCEITWRCHSSSLQRLVSSLLLCSPVDIAAMLYTSYEYFTGRELQCTRPFTATYANV